MRLDEEVRDRDAIGKQKNKLNIDAKRGAKEGELHEGGRSVVETRLVLDPSTDIFLFADYKR